MEGKTRSNKATVSSRNDRCSAHRECVSDSEQLSFLGPGKKKPHSQVVQEAEFAVVGIGIALLHSHAQKAAFALNRSGDFAGAGREIALLPERRFQPSAAVSCLSLAENGPLQPAAFLRRVSGLLCAHRKGAVCTSPWLHADCTRLALNTMSLPIFRGTIRPCAVLHCYTFAFREEKSGRENPLQ